MEKFSPTDPLNRLRRDSLRARWRIGRMTAWRTLAKVRRAREISLPPPSTTLRAVWRGGIAATPLAKSGAGQGPWPWRHPTGAVRIPAGAGITGAGLDPSGTPADLPANGSGGEGCWGEAADAEPNGVVVVGRVVAVPVGRAAVVGFVEPGAAAQQLGDPPDGKLIVQGRSAAKGSPANRRRRNRRVWPWARWAFQLSSD